MWICTNIYEAVQQMHPKFAMGRSVGEYVGTENLDSLIYVESSMSISIYWRCRSTYFCFSENLVWTSLFVSRKQWKEDIIQVTHQAFIHDLPTVYQPSNKSLYRLVGKQPATNYEIVGIQSQWLEKGFVFAHPTVAKKHYDSKKSNVIVDLS